MTTTDPTHTRSDNSGVRQDSDADASGDTPPRVPNPDAQAVYEYLQTVDSATLEGLAAKAGLPEAYLTDLLDGLQERGLVSVETGFRVVRVSLAGPDDADDTGRAHDAESRPDDGASDGVATDGGHGLVKTVADSLTTETTPSVNLTPEELWTVLDSRRRRRLVRLLAVLHDPETEYYLDVQDVAAALSTATNGTRTRETRHGEHHRIYVTLVETHLPLLDDHDLVAYYERPQKVQAADDIVDVARVLELVDGSSRDLWPSTAADDEGQR